MATPAESQIVSKIVIVTDPDDVAINGFRMLLVDLNEDQLAIVSKCLEEVDNTISVVIYMWASGNSTEWLHDKKLKSNCVICNATSISQTVIVYLIASANTHYFGMLPALAHVNPNIIFGQEDCKAVIETEITKYNSSFL